VGALARKAKLVEKLVNALKPQVNPPLLPDQALRPPAGPLMAVQAAILILT